MHDSLITFKELPDGRVFYRCKKCKDGWIGDEDHVCYRRNISPYTKRKGKNLGLGDKTEELLKRHGVTQESYKEIKERFGFMPSCNCKRRIAWLNKVGDYLGISFTAKSVKS